MFSVRYTYPTEQEAQAALARQRRVKERRGYLEHSQNPALTM